MPRGATVLYAESRQDAAKLVAQIARARREEGHQDQVDGVGGDAVEPRARRDGRAVDRDGSRRNILQINGNEPPSHIIAPVVHKDKDEIADLFAKTHNKPRLTDIPEMMKEAREVLRPHFM